MIVGVESPSFLEALLRFPGALVRFPSAAVDTLDAINDLAERIDHLLALLEPMQGGIGLAGTGVNIASSGIAQALAGLQQAVERLDTSVLPPFSLAASQLRSLSARLNGTALDFSIPTDADADDGPRGRPVEDGLDGEEAHHAEHRHATSEPPLVELELSMVELAHSLDSLVGAIPVLRQVIRITASAAPDPGHDDQA